MDKNFGMIASFYCSWDLASDTFHLGLCLSLIFIWHILWLKRGSRVAMYLYECILFGSFVCKLVKSRYKCVCALLRAGLFWADLSIIADNVSDACVQEEYYNTALCSLRGSNTHLCSWMFGWMLEHSY